MRRPLAGLVFFFLGAVDAAAQRDPAVVVELRGGSDVPQAAVRLRGLLNDGRFLRAMRSGFPLYLEYEVALHRTRSNWFDPRVSSSPLEYVILYDPVREVFVAEDADGTEEVGDEDALRRRLERVYVFELLPDQDGVFYYDVSVSVRTLSDSDVDEVFDWLRGDDDSTVVRQRGFLTRSARRLLVQVAPLPRLTLSDKSRTFRWPR